LFIFQFIKKHCYLLKHPEAFLTLIINIGLGLAKKIKSSPINLLLKSLLLYPSISLLHPLENLQINTHCSHSWRYATQAISDQEAEGRAVDYFSKCLSIVSLSIFPD